MKPSSIWMLLLMEVVAHGEEDIQKFSFFLDSVNWVAEAQEK